MNSKIELLFQILGIWEKDSNKSLIIDDLYQKIENLRKMSEFNALLIQEMIQADMIPPIILKKTQLKSDIKTAKAKIDRISGQYDKLKEIAPEAELERISKEMVIEFNMVEELEKTLAAIENT